MEEKSKLTTVGGVPTGGTTKSGNPEHEPGTGEFGPKGGSSSLEKKLSFKEKMDQRRDLKNKSLFVGAKAAYEAKKDSIQSLENFEEAKEKNRSIRNLEKRVRKETIDALAEKTREMFENNSLGMRIKFVNLLSAIKMERFINLHEAGHGGGCTNSDVRMRFSNNVFGSTYQSSRVNRYGLEKYGCLMSKNIGESIDWSDGADHYGDCAVTFKNSRVKGRTTYTFDDSLSSDVVIPGLAGGDFDINCYVSTYAASQLDSRINDIIKNSKTLKDFKRELGVGYIEVQYHGELTLDDVESIRLQDKWLASPELKKVISNQLKEKNIPVYTYDFRTKKQYQVKINENGELYKEEVNL